MQIAFSFYKENFHEQVKLMDIVGCILLIIAKVSIAEEIKITLCMEQLIRNFNNSRTSEYLIFVEE